MQSCVLPCPLRSSLLWSGKAVSLRLRGGREFFLSNACCKILVYRCGPSLRLRSGSSRSVRFAHIPAQPHICPPPAGGAWCTVASCSLRSHSRHRTPRRMAGGGGKCREGIEAKGRRTKVDGRTCPAANGGGRSLLSCGMILAAARAGREPLVAASNPDAGSLPARAACIFFLSTEKENIIKSDILVGVL